MSIVKSSLLSFALVAVTSAGALAHDLSAVHRTQAWQALEIERQRQAGQLTRRERDLLLAEQARIAELERQARADGVVTGREYRALRQAQHGAGAHIYEESHDRQVNYWRLWKARNGYRY